MGLAAAVAYHNIFDYPLRQHELSKWFCAKPYNLVSQDTIIASRDKFFFLAGRDELILKKAVSRKSLKAESKTCN